MPRMSGSPYPKNVPGPFYVVCDVCIFCEVPSIEAPDLITHDRDGGHHCYFKRQPSTPAELDQAIRACVLSCVSSIRYAGDDPKVLKRLQDSGRADQCDVLRDPHSTTEKDQPRPGASPTLLEILKRIKHPLYDRELDV